MRAAYFAICASTVAIGLSVWSIVRSVQFIRGGR